MSLVSEQFILTTTPREISGHNVMGTLLTLVNHEHGSGKKIYIGGADVSPTTGLLLDGFPITLDLYPMSHVHACTDSGQAVLGVIYQRRN